MVVVLLHAPTHQESFTVLQRVSKPSVFRTDAADFEEHRGADREGQNCGWSMAGLEEIFIV